MRILVTFTLMQLVLAANLKTQETKLEDILKKLEGDDPTTRELGQKELENYVDTDKKAQEVKKLIEKAGLEAKLRAEQVLKNYEIKKQGYIAFGGPDVISLLSADGKNSKEISTGIKSLSGMSNPKLVWSPDGTRIALLHGDLYVIDILKDSTTNLTKDHKIEKSLGTYSYGDLPAPNWSRDGKKIVFDRKDIFVIDADGSNLVNLTKDVKKPLDNYPVFPNWSPDGKKIVYMGYTKDRGRYEVHVMDDDGKNDANLTAEMKKGYNCWFPRFAGEKIIFKFQFATDIYSMDIDGKNKKNLTDGKISGIHRFFPSPDGKKIACFGKLDDSSLQVIDLDNIKEPKKFKIKMTPEMHMSWSSDSKKIVYCFNEDRSHVPNPDTGIYIFDIESGTSEQIAKTKKVGMPAWQPSQIKK